MRDNYSHRWLPDYDPNPTPILGPPIPSMVSCARCGCCSLDRKGFCVGPCTECGHHLIEDCPRCEDKDKEIMELREFIEAIVDGANHQFRIR